MRERKYWGAHYKYIPVTLNGVLQRYGASFRVLTALYNLVAGLVQHGINAGKSNQGLLSLKAAHITRSVP